jgi:hypothetical protein
VDFTTLEGERRLALVARGVGIKFLDAMTLEETKWFPEGFGAPQNQLAAADLGGGRGLGFFVSSGEGSVGGYGGGGQSLPGWPVRASRGPLTVPALGDLDGDGSLDVVCTGQDPADPARWLVWAWNVEGLVKTGFPVSLYRFAGDSLGCTLADLDGNPGVEVVVADRVADGVGWIHVLRGDGTELPGWPVWCPGGAAVAPVVGRGASSPVVWIVSRGQCSAFSSTGSLLISIMPPSLQAPFDPAVVDLDGDGLDDLVVSTGDMTYVRYLRGPAPSTSLWPVTSPHPVGAPLAGHASASAPTGVLLMTGIGVRAMTTDGSYLPTFGGLGLPAAAPTLGAPIADDRTTLFTGLDPNGWLYSFRAPAESWSEVPQAWPTQRGNFARTGSQLGAPPMSAADSRPPARVADLSAMALSPTSIQLTWTAPGDDSPLGRAIHYDLRVGPDPIPSRGRGWPGVAALARRRGDRAGRGRRGFDELRQAQGRGRFRELERSLESGRGRHHCTHRPPTAIRSGAGEQPGATAGSPVVVDLGFDGWHCLPRGARPERARVAPGDAARDRLGDVLVERGRRRRTCARSRSLLRDPGCVRGEHPPQAGAAPTVTRSAPAPGGSTAVSTRDRA